MIRQAKCESAILYLIQIFMPPIQSAEIEETVAQKVKKKKKDRVGELSEKKDNQEQSVWGGVRH